MCFQKIIDFPCDKLTHANGAKFALLQIKITRLSQLIRIFFGTFRHCYAIDNNLIHNCWKKYNCHLFNKAWFIYVHTTQVTHCLIFFLIKKVGMMSLRSLSVNVLKSSPPTPLSAKQRINSLIFANSRNKNWIDRIIYAKLWCLSAADYY